MCTKVLGEKNENIYIFTKSILEVLESWWVPKETEEFSHETASEYDEHTFTITQTLSKQIMQGTHLGWHLPPEAEHWLKQVNHCHDFHLPRDRHRHCSIFSAVLANLPFALTCSGGLKRCTSTEHLSTRERWGDVIFKKLLKYQSLQLKIAFKIILRWT